MLFLTATPIQTSSENLYQLLKLEDLDQFYDTETFLHQVDINAPLIKIANLLRRSVTDTELLKQYFVEVEEHKLYYNEIGIKLDELLEYNAPSLINQSRRSLTEKKRIYKILDELDSANLNTGTRNLHL